jgi:hypothetical protein
VDEQYVAACALGNVLGDAPFEQVLEESGLLNTDNDQVGLPLLGEFEDSFRRRSGVRDEFGANGASFEKRPRPLEVLICEVEFLCRFACEAR